MDLSKAETIEAVMRIKEESIREAEEKRCKIAHIFVLIGFRLDGEYHKSVLTEREAPLSETTMAHHYSVTTTGELINMPQLVADLTSHPSQSAVLIQEYDEDLEDMAYEIKATHLHADARGRAAFMEEGLNHVEGQTSLCYWK